MGRGIVIESRMGPARVRRGRRGRGVRVRARCVSFLWKETLPKVNLTLDGNYAGIDGSIDWQSLLMIDGVHTTMTEKKDFTPLNGRTSKASKAEIAVNRLMDSDLFLRRKDYGESEDFRNKWGGSNVAKARFSERQVQEMINQRLDEDGSPLTLAREIELRERYQYGSKETLEAKKAKLAGTTGKVAPTDLAALLAQADKDASGVTVEN